jgi:translation initiation factor IF-2
MLFCLGLNLQVAQKSDEVDILREEVSRDLRKALSNIKLQERGVYVQASTLGSLEALLEFLRTSKIPVSTQFDSDYIICVISCAVVVTYYYAFFAQIS